MIRDYTIKDKLGTGSYGTVYKVTKKTDKNIYVLKQISLFGLTPSQIEGVKNEANILSQMNSTYVVKYCDSFEDKNFLNIVMEFCDGGDLSKFLEIQKKTGRKIKEDLIWKLFIEISIGLGYLHKKKVLHRDLKTLNIFLTKALEVKIGDLGVAKALNQNNFAKTYIGTPYYLSPEICEERPYNEKSDVWALGCILYELCTYNHPFDAKTQAGLILKILKSKYEPISRSYSYHLHKMIECLLEKDDNKRPNVSDIIKKHIMIKKAKELGLYTNILEVFPEVDKESSPSNGDPFHHKEISEDKIAPPTPKSESKNIKKKVAQPFHKEVKKCVRENKINIYNNYKKREMSSGNLVSGYDNSKKNYNSNHKDNESKNIDIPNKDNKIIPKKDEKRKILSKNFKISDKKDQPTKIKIIKPKLKNNPQVLKKEELENVNKKIDDFEKRIKESQEKQNKKIQENKDEQKKDIMEIEASDFFKNLSNMPIDEDPPNKNANVIQFAKDIDSFLQQNKGQDVTSSQLSDLETGQKTNLENLINDFQNMSSVKGKISDIQLGKISDVQLGRSRLQQNPKENIENPPEIKPEYEVVKNSLYVSQSEQQEEIPKEKNQQPKPKIQQPINSDSDSDDNLNNEEEQINKIQIQKYDSDNDDEDLEDERVLEFEDTTCNKDDDDEEGDEVNSDEDEPKVVRASNNQLIQNKKELLLKEKKIQTKLEGLKKEIKTLLGESDGQRIMDLFQKSSEDIDDTTNQIFTFIKEKHPNKEDTFNNFYLLLVSYDVQLFNINKELKQYSQIEIN